MAINIYKKTTYKQTAEGTLNLEPFPTKWKEMFTTVKKNYARYNNSDIK